MTDPNSQTPYEPPAGQPYQAGQPYSPGPGQPGTPGQPYQQAAPAGPAVPLTQAEDKQWAMFAHFGGILWILPALIIYLVFKDRGPFTRQEAKEALNWQITFIGSFIILSILVSILSAVLLFSGGYAIIGLISWLPGVLYLLNLIFSIMGGVKVNSGQAYRYPVSLRLIK